MKALRKYYLEKIFERTHFVRFIWDEQGQDSLMTFFEILKFSECNYFFVSVPSPTDSTFDSFFRFK